jgi:hypothetical protein
MTILARGAGLWQTELRRRGTLEFPLERPDLRKDLL